MGVASGCGEQEVGVASGSGWNLWVWLLGVVLRRYIDFLILLIPTPLVSVLFCSSIPTFLFIFFNVFRSCIYRKSVPLNSPESSPLYDVNADAAFCTLVCAARLYYMFANCNHTAA